MARKVSLVAGGRVFKETDAGLVSGKLQRGDGSIFWKPPYVEKATGKKKKGHWVASVFLNGKRKNFYFNTKRQAREHLLTLAGRWSTATGAATITTDQYLTHWLAAVKDTVKFRTHQSYAGLVKHHLAPGLKDIPLRSLKARHVQKLIDKKKTSVSITTGRRLTPRTLALMRVVLSIALNRAVLDGYIPRNPVAGRAILLPRGRRNVPEVWTETQVDQFLRAISGDRLEALYRVALMMGLREGEVLGLQWPDIDFGQATLTVRNELQRNGSYELVEPKTRSSQATLPMPAPVVAILRAHKKDRWKQPPRPWDQLVFPTSNGTPISARNLIRAFKRTIKAGGLPDIRFHDLRTLFITRLALNGAPVRVAMALARHSSITTTMNIYARVGDIDQREALRKAWPGTK